jgi:tripartite-type tricarboxylate transporter receptor subunit TctC
VSLSVWKRRVPLLLALVLAPLGALAQPYPAKPVKVIVPSSAGGVLDMLSRALSQRLGETLAQPFVTETRAGANGILGADMLAKSAPDGYTLMFTAAAPVSINPFVYERLPYDPRTFAPVAMCCVMAQAVVVNASLKVNSLQELIALAKSAPGKLAYGSIGAGSSSNVYMEGLKRQAGIDVVHVPYKGSAPAVTDLVGGRVAMMVVTLGVIQGHLASGKLKALAVGSPRRSSAYADVPTAAEAGLPGWDAEVWMGTFAPGGTPKDIVARLNAEMTRIVSSAAFNEQWLKKNGFDLPPVTTPEQFAEYVKNDMHNSERVIKAAGIKLD